MTLSELEQRLGHKFTKTLLLEQALTHRSFGPIHNERLEFLGDSVLNCCIACLIFEQFPAMQEGQLSRLRANLVNQTILAEIALGLELNNLLKLGDGEIKTGGQHRPSILGDTFEAILGAILLDANFVTASNVVRRLFESRIETLRDAKPVKDAKTELQEWLQSKHLPLPEYTVKRIEGESHRQTFHVECQVLSLGMKSTGIGSSRRVAEQDAAAQALLALADSGSGLYAKDVRK
ncbi:MAG: ribonuclease III [Burkholderiales bacterium]|nr:ribonuclease III [Burkholderiales bacterium]